MPTSPKNKTRPWVIPRDKYHAPTSKGRNRDKDMHTFYKSKRWRATRLYILQRNPLCKTCEDKNVITPATIVDHIQPIRQGGDALDKNNLQPLCKVCHDKKSGQEAHTIVYTDTTMYP
jgi:5-methylcytosine-specific restriction protein A